MNRTVREKRKHGLGGSDVAAIFGLSPYKTAFEVWLEKTGQLDNRQEGDEEEQDEETAAQLRGKVLEPAVAQWYANEHEVTLFHPESQRAEALPLIGPEDWMLGNPDRLVLDTTCRDGVYIPQLDLWARHGVEVKTDRTRKGYGATGTDEVRVDYQLQGSWYMLLTRLARWDYAVYFPIHDEFCWYSTFRDPSIEQRIVDTAGAWWHRHILGGDEPALDASKGAADWLLDQHRIPQASERPASEAESALIAEYRAVLTPFTALEKEKKRLENEIKAYIADSRGLTGDFGSLIWGAVQGRKTLDMDRLRADHPSLVETYTKQGKPYRALRKNWKEK